MISNNKVYLIIIFLVSLLVVFNSCTCDPPTKNEDDDNSSKIDSIPSEMLQEHIPWPSLADSPWPMYRHDPQHTGRSQFVGPQLGEIKWQVQAKGVQSSNGLTSCTVDEESNAYINSSYESHEGFGQVWNLYSIDNDGNINWTWFDSTNHHQEIESVPLITSDNNLLFTSWKLSGQPTTSYLNAVNTDGKFLWQYSDGAWFGDEINIGIDGTIYLINNHGLMALNPDGSLKWEREKSGDFSVFEGLAISPDGQTIYVNGNAGDDDLYAVSVDGTVKWIFNDSTPSQHFFYNQPMVDSQGNVYFNTIDSLYCISPTGDKRWVYDRAFSSDHMVIDTNGHLIIYTLRKLTKLDYAGNVIWQIDHDYVQPGIVIDAVGNIYTIGQGSGISCISGIDGSTIWKLEMDISHPSFYAPSLGDGVLYFANCEHDNNVIFAIH